MSSEASPRRLTQNQWRLIAAALALVSFTVILAFCFGIFLLFRGFVTTFAHALWPLAVSGVLALMLRPLVVFFQRKLKFNRTWAIISLYLLVVSALASALALLLPTIIEQAISLADFLPSYLSQLRDAIANHYPAVITFLEERLSDDTQEQLRQSISNALSNLLKTSEMAIGKIGAFISSTISLSTGLAIIPIYLFFMLESNRNLSNDLRDQLSFIRDEWRDDAVFLINEFIGSIVLFFRGQVLIALIMGVLLAIGFTSIGLNFAIILGLSIGLLNIIPYLGSIIGLGTVLPLAYFQNDGGGMNMTLFSLGIFIFVQMIEGYVLTPKIMGKSTGLHPMVIIIAIFFWGTALDGLLGMILAIPLTAFFVVAWRLVKMKYLTRIKEKAD